MQYDNYSLLCAVYDKCNPIFFKRTMDSMLAQTKLTNDFVIVKDGKLTPELDEILDTYALKYSFIHIEGYDINKGSGAAYNFGLKKCKNELVAIVDSDDISLPTRCEREMELFNLNPNLEAVGTAIYEFQDSEDIITGVKKMPVTIEEIRQYARRRNPINHPTIMYKKTTIQNFGGYHEKKRGEDFELATKLVFAGCIVENINEPLLKYRTNESQYERRSSITDAKAVIGVVKNNYKKGYIGYKDYFFVTVAQCAGLIIPKKIGRMIFQKMFREKEI